MHSTNERLDERQAMKTLCDFGYARAVILNYQDIGHNWHCIHFHHREPAVPVPADSHRQRSPWPGRFQHQRTQAQLFPVFETVIPKDNCQLMACFDMNDLTELMASSHNVLTTSFDIIELPDTIRTELQQYELQSFDDIRQLDQFHRLLIYTDGSSIPAMRRLPAERADDLGHPDAWSFVVVGEVFIDERSSKLTVLGWTSQPVRYTPGGSAFTGITRTGSDMAERSALIGAASWRLSIDHAIPTVFCFDSLLSSGQAKGSIGTAEPDESYMLLRGLFQALELALPHDQLVLHHTRAHAGDLFNEIVRDVVYQHGTMAPLLYRHRSCLLLMTLVQIFQESLSTWNRSSFPAVWPLRTFSRCTGTHRGKEENCIIFSSRCAHTISIA